MTCIKHKTLLLVLSMAAATAANAGSATSHSLPGKYWHEVPEGSACSEWVGREYGRPAVKRVQVQAIYVYICIAGPWAGGCINVAPL